MDTWDLFVKDNSNDLEIVEDSNDQTRQEELGCREIQAGIVERNWCLYATDKSSKLVLDTWDNLNSCMEPHYINESQVTIEGVHSSENHLNNHSKDLLYEIKFFSRSNKGGTALDILISICQQ